MTLTRRFKPYPRYKDSGVEWLGKIPERWDRLPLKRIVGAPITDGPHETPEFLPEGVPFLSVDSIVEGRLDFESCRFVSQADHERFCRKCRPMRGDVLLGKAASVGKVAVVEVGFEFSIWSPLALIRTDRVHLLPQYLYYYLLSKNAQDDILLQCTHNTQNNISMDDIKALSIPRPTIPEQRAIAAFLDREIERIDALVEKKERLIELLQEKRTALISHAVTKGLDPNVPMKDSGVEWLGKIPRHWEVKRLKRLVSSPVEKGKGRELPFIDLENIVPAEGRVLEGYDWPEKFADEYATFLVGDVLFGKLRPYLAKCLCADRAGCCPTELLIFRPRAGAYCSKYLHYLVLSRLFLSRAEAMSYGTKMPRTSWDKLGPTHTWCPPQHEQDAIVSFLDRETQKIDALVAKVREAIERLKEYRTALISAAVTGKIDVKGLA